MPPTTLPMISHKLWSDIVYKFLILLLVTTGYTFKSYERNRKGIKNLFSEYFSSVLFFLYVFTFSYLNRLTFCLSFIIIIFFTTIILYQGAFLQFS
jgi:hypothetical protein